MSVADTKKHIDMSASARTDIPAAILQRAEFIRQVFEKHGSTQKIMTLLAYPVVGYGASAGNWQY